MLIEFENLGGIKKTELDLRPFTVIIGPNNSNKTYLAYAVYGVANRFTKYHPGFNGISVINNYNSELSQLKIEKFLTPIQTINYNSTLTFNTDFFLAYYLYGNAALFEFNLSVNQFYQDNSNQLFNNFKIKIKPNNHFLNHKYYGKESPIYFEYYWNGFKIENVSAFWFDDFFRKNFPFEMLPFGFNNAYILPSERNTFIQTYKYFSNRRLKKFIDFNRNKIEKHIATEQGAIVFPQPIEDYLEMLSSIDLEPKTKDAPENPFHQLANFIEKSLQNSHQIVWQKTNLGGNQLAFKVNKKTIDLYNASSSAKGLAPLLLYLRYRAQAGDLLVIDEPEMNLHPETQVKLLEALAILVNLGVKVLMTTHSPYFLSHLNNLMQPPIADEKLGKKMAKALYLNDARAFLTEEQISAYEMKDFGAEGFKLQSLKDPDYGVRWDTLSDVAVEVQNKFFDLAEIKRAAQKRKEKPAHGEKA